MRRATAAAVALTLLLGACAGSGDTATVRIEPSGTETAADGPTASAPSSAPTLAATPAQPVSTVTPTPVPAAPQPTTTPAPGDLDGSPFSTADMRAAVEGPVEGRGYTLWLAEEHGVDCAATSVPGRPYWSANRAGSDFGPVFVLWVYPDQDALRADWAVEPGKAPQPLVEGCELPTGFTYWNENLVLTFSVWLSLGEEIPLVGHGESPRDHPAVRAFLELTP